MTAALVCKITK